MRSTSFAWRHRDCSDASSVCAIPDPALSKALGPGGCFRSNPTRTRCRPAAYFDRSLLLNATGSTSATAAS